MGLRWPFVGNATAELIGTEGPSLRLRISARGSDVAQYALNFA